MKIKYVEIQNYRKLKSCRIELTDHTTIFVGANNSGKTTAMDALKKFLKYKKTFDINDVTLSNWIEINEIGIEWCCTEEKSSEELDIERLALLMPTMDIWIEVKDQEIHYVDHLIPTLDWKGGLLGVRLRLEPTDIQGFYKEFTTAFTAAKKTIAAARETDNDELVMLWPTNARDYLNKKLQATFGLKAYLLDPQKLVSPENGIARPQVLPKDSEALSGDPFKSLFLIHSINAQRGFSDSTSQSNDTDEETNGLLGNLSQQLRAYYNTHLNPNKSPNPTDIKALRAIESAQNEFDLRLHQGFEQALSELGGMGYPGFYDPKITISTKIQPVDGLKHSSAVQFDLMSGGNQYKDLPLRLPENYNGLGYQNLISIIFKMMQFRDEWMRVGKLASSSINNNDEFLIPPIQIVLLEEPEAHLHIQAQQVFIRQVYSVLRNHDNLRENKDLTTQLIVSTHSGHIAHEMSFSQLRYFRRKAVVAKNEVPISTVVNLSDVFGENEKDTERFVTRYLQLTHCDLLFADAAILIEGAAERMLLPHFIKNNFKELSQRYISLLEIGGSHAHTLKPLIEALGLTSLIVTDLDSIDPITKKATLPNRKKGLLTANDTLKQWVPCKEIIDELYEVDNNDKCKRYDSHFSVRVAYQIPTEVVLTLEISSSFSVEILPYTFEDALAFENYVFFKGLDGKGLISKFNTAMNNLTSISEIRTQLFNDLRAGKKAEFALELIFKADFENLRIPSYIKEGLEWLEKELQQNKWTPSEDMDNITEKEVVDS